MGKKQLKEDEIQRIHSQARQKLVEYSKLNDVIGTEIFSILEKSSRVLYYPLEDQKIWGFSDRKKGKAFVCINTSLPYDKQVFVAGHELYHIWFSGAGEIFSADNLDEKVELLANRFAAEFLVDETLLRQEIDAFDMDKKHLKIKEIVRLSTLFMVPYKTMVRRLDEIGLLTAKQADAYLTYTDEQVEIWRKRLGLSIPERENLIGLSTLIDQALSLYEKHMITYEKLEYLLAMANLTPLQMGVKLDDFYLPPSAEVALSGKKISFDTRKSL